MTLRRRTAPTQHAGLTRQGGVTLVELLIGMALALTVLFAASNLLTSSSRSATDLQGRNELLEESQIAQNYVAGQLREAAFVFPAGTTLNLGSGYTTQRPGTTGGTWVVGAAATPIVAFVRSPRVSGNCAADAEACYKFMAYYPVRRGFWASNATGSNNPGPDPANAGRWVLVEYRSNYATKPSLAALGSNYTPPGGEGRLLLDYVRPASLAPAGTPALFTQTPDATPSTPQEPGDVQVSVNLAISRQVGSASVTIPTAQPGSAPEAAVRTVTVAPRNLGNLSP